MSELRVAITFDAEHPSRPPGAFGSGARIADVLDRAGARATFFLQGRWTTAYPEMARRLADGPHLIGNHSNYHAPMPFLTGQGLEEDVRGAERRIGEVVGIDPRPWFRCPFGEGAADPRVLTGLEALGYRDVQWNVDPQDWRPGRSADELTDAVIEGVRRHGDGAIVLLHVWPAATADSLPPILAGLASEGAAFVTVGDLFP